MTELQDGKLAKRKTNSPVPPVDDASASVATEARPRRMLTEAQVLEVVPVSTATLFRMEKSGRFPRGTFISPNRKVWFEDEIVAWQNAIGGKARPRANR